MKILYEYYTTRYIFLIFIFTLFYFTILYWFCHTLTWIHHGCTCDPKHEPPSHLSPYNIPLGHPHAPAPSMLYLNWYRINSESMLLGIFYIFNSNLLVKEYFCPVITLISQREQFIVLKTRYNPGVEKPTPGCFSTGISESHVLHIRWKIYI